MTFTGSMIGIDSQVKLKMVLAIFPIRSKLDYIALLILQPTQIAKLLWKIWCHVSVFVKTLLSHIKRWCLAYRSDDLSLCNTNNGTESLNEVLKYGELKGLKQSTLSAVLVILVNSFIPKHCKKYIKFNVRDDDGCKRYASGIPSF